MVIASCALQADFHCMRRDVTHAVRESIRIHLAAPSASIAWLVHFQTRAEQASVGIALLAMRALPQELLRVGNAEQDCLLPPLVPQHAAYAHLGNLPRHWA